MTTTIQAILNGVLGNVGIAIEQVFRGVLPLSVAMIVFHMVRKGVAR